METAKEIQDDMRREVAKHNGSVARRTARRAAEALSEAVYASGVRYDYSDATTAADVRALLDKLDPLIDMLEGIEHSLALLEAELAELDQAAPASGEMRIEVAPDANPALVNVLKAGGLL